jgi:hypothetical protein
MLMLRDGRIAGGGVVSAGARSAAAGESRVRVSFAQAYDDLAARLSALELKAEHIGADESVLVLSGPEAETAALAKLVGAGLMVRGFAPVRATLEETYRQESRRPWGDPS